MRVPVRNIVILLWDCMSMSNVYSHPLYQVVPVLLPLVARFSSIRIHLPPDLRQSDARHGVFKTITEVKRRFPDGELSL
jgi:hypothetical protein